MPTCEVHDPHPYNCCWPAVITHHVQFLGCKICIPLRSRCRSVELTVTASANARAPSGGMPLAARRRDLVHPTLLEKKMPRDALLHSSFPFICLNQTELTFLDKRKQSHKTGVIAFSGAHRMHNTPPHVPPDPPFIPSHHTHTPYRHPTGRPVPSTHRPTVGDQLILDAMFGGTARPSASPGPKNNASPL